VVEWQQRLPVMCCHSVGMKHLALGWLLIIARSLARNKQSLVTANQQTQNRPEIRSGQVRSDQGYSRQALLFRPINSGTVFLRPSGASAFAAIFRRYSLLVVWPVAGCRQVADDSVPDSASSGSSSAAPLTALHRSCKVGIPTL
jgi:hypothetical protein